MYPNNVLQSTTAFLVQFGVRKYPTTGLISPGSDSKPPSDLAGDLLLGYAALPAGYGSEAIA